MSNFSLFPSAGTGDMDLSFETVEYGFTTIRSYDLIACEIKNLYTEELNAGVQTFNINLNEVPRFISFCSDYG